MSTTLTCDHCGEEISEAPIRVGNKNYCCQACVFEALRSKDCGGRTDSPISHSIVEQTEDITGGINEQD